MVWAIILTFVTYTGPVYQIRVYQAPAPEYTTQAECEAQLPVLDRALRDLYPDRKADVKSITSHCTRQPAPERRGWQ